MPEQAAVPPPPVTALAFDFGLRQIGVAVGQTLTGSASPLTVISARDGQPDWTVVDALVKEWRPGLLLVGLPLNMDDSESEFCARARKFGRRLHGRTGLKTLMIDERLSTREAKARGGRRESYREHPVDNLAAQVILEGWLRDPEHAREP
jgi:putative Holliday junction resolvase